MVKTIRKVLDRFRYPKIHPVKFGIAGGIATAVCVLLTTILTIFGYCTSCGFLLMDVYGLFGYTLSFFGAILGAIYSFIDGFIITWIFASVYNKLL